MTYRGFNNANQRRDQSRRREEPSKKSWKPDFEKCGKWGETTYFSDTSPHKSATTVKSLEEYAHYLRNEADSLMKRLGKDFK